MLKREYKFWNFLFLALKETIFSNQYGSIRFNFSQTLETSISQLCDIVICTCSTQFNWLSNRSDWVYIAKHSYTEEFLAKEREAERDRSNKVIASGGEEQRNRETNKKESLKSKCLKERI